ncbi:jerky protein homolog-like [Eurosta solidaginis]|uniref:jerky protein homolog-like n=1 Tax=Eurosta solidaginis TaxID=178769 RepID=UPI0035310849
MNVRDLEEGTANLLSYLRPEPEVCVLEPEWSDDAIECNDNEIGEISDDDGDCSVEADKTITSKEAIDMFNKILEWAEIEMVNKSDLNVLKKLREKEVFKMLEQKKQQKRITNFSSSAKMEKQRVTFLCCSNASGSHQLKLLVVGKAKNPRWFKGFDCPLYYRHSKSAWMTAAIFKDWFHHSFIPEVTKFLIEKGLPVKAILLINNAPSYSPEDELKSEGGCILARFMPPNVTPLIQPMDQNAIRITKLYYRNSILASVAAKGFKLLEALKQITLKDAIVTLESAWSKVDAVVLSKRWSNVLSMVENQEDPEDDIPLSVLRSNLIMNVRDLEEGAANLLSYLRPEVEFIAFNVREWSDDAIECNDNEIEEISDDDGDCSVEAKKRLHQRKLLTCLIKLWNGLKLKWLINRI